ncbi:MAG: VanW family protein [Chloroflexota bacterium]
MANGMRQDHVTRVRREELIRPAERRREFPTRIAQRYLEKKERPRWALIAYLVVLLVTLAIGSVTYTTYAFSKYRGEILPGVYVDTAYVGEMTSSQAERRVSDALQPVYARPIVLTYHGVQPWRPAPDAIGYKVYPIRTVTKAQAVGRVETFPEQLFDRLPVHPNHVVPLDFSLDNRVLRGYILRYVNPRVRRVPQDAGLQLNTRQSAFAVVPSHTGERLDVPATMMSIAKALGTLSTPTLALPVHHLTPGIGDSVAASIQRRVENFLTHAPVYAVGKSVTMISRVDLAPMISFQTEDDAHHREIKMIVDSNKVQAFVQRLTANYDRPAQDPRLGFDGRNVRVIRTSRIGRQLNGQDAYTKLLAAITGLRSRARIHLKITAIQPALDESNPATLGITKFLALGESAFPGAGDRRLQDITRIAGVLDSTLIRPGQDISFNQLVGLAWDPRVYDDRETESNGGLVPADSGAMQQVATTWFRALLITGLDLTERHAHIYHLTWYDNPVGLDAIVSQDGKDLRFHNNTGKYLFIKTRVEPVRQELYVYVFGPKLGWQVTLSHPNILAQLPHPPQKIVQDPSLNPGETHHLAFAHNGLDVQLQRTVVYPDGRVHTTTLRTRYRPWQAVVAVGPLATPTPTPKAKPTRTASPTSTAVTSPTASPSPKPTATFVH